MKINVVSFSTIDESASLNEWENQFAAVFDFVELGHTVEAQVTVLPELCFMSAAKYFEHDLKKLAAYLWSNFIPRVVGWFGESNGLVILGTAPRLDQNGQLKNSCPIIKNGTLHCIQDKLQLTPWETDFVPGDQLQVIEFCGLKTAVLICYDIEQPAFSHLLKREGVSIVFCPSATSTQAGSERVLRCASARAVELGAAVVVAPLVGQNINDLIDHSEGRQGVFLPSQEIVPLEQQQQYSIYSHGEWEKCSYTLPEQMLRDLKKDNGETKPYLILQETSTYGIAHC